MTTKTRITVPEGHVALVLTSQRATELSDLCRLLRRELKHKVKKGGKYPANSTEVGMYEIAGDIMLALLEARS